MIAPQDRYEVRPLGEVFVIRDVQMRGFCSLRGRKVLTWPTREGAERWLSRCYRMWGTSPAIGEEPPHKTKWRAPSSTFTENVRRSPWETWTAPINPNERGYPNG